MMEITAFSLFLYLISLVLYFIAHSVVWIYHINKHQYTNQQLVLYHERPSTVIRTKSFTLPFQLPPDPNSCWLVWTSCGSCIGPAPFPAKTTFCFGYSTKSSLPWLFRISIIGSTSGWLTIGVYGQLQMSWWSSKWEGRATYARRSC